MNPKPVFETNFFPKPKLQSSAPNASNPVVAPPIQYSIHERSRDKKLIALGATPPVENCAPEKRTHNEKKKETVREKKKFAYARKSE